MCPGKTGHEILLKRESTNAKRHDKVQKRGSKDSNLKPLLHVLDKGCYEK
jgi:hypothetical protein